MKQVRTFSLAVLVLTATALCAQTIIHVPGDQTTIQSAIAAAQNGDTVLVASGTYNENINFQGKSITVASASGPAATTITGTGVGPVVTFNSGNASQAVLQGFTITGGACAFLANGYYGGGIYAGTNETPTIQGNIITQNHGCDAAGIEVNFASPIIKNNVISFNQQYQYSGGNGGAGIQILGSGAAPAQIIGNSITDNVHSSMGGGIGMNGGGSALIKNNFIARNSAYNEGGGISLINGSSPQIIQNVIVNNVVTNPSGEGGGISFLVPANPAAIYLLNNTLVGNSASEGSALYAANYGPAVAVIEDNILAGSGTGGAVYCSTYVSTVPALSFNDVFNASGAAYAGACADQTGMNGNISADPLFVNASAGNYQLTSSSPAIDAGSNSAASLPPLDYAGNPRIVDGKNRCTATVDLGAYEFQASPLAGLSPTALSFAPQDVGTSSSQQPVSLSNTGTTCLHISGYPISGEFSLVTGCGAALPAGQACNLYVTFSPLASGTTTGLVAVNSDSPVTPSVALSGTGVDFALSATPSSATVTAGKSAAYKVTVSALGGTFGSAVSLQCAGIPAFSTCSFSPASVTPGSASANATMTVATTARHGKKGTPAGTSTITVSGTSGPLSHSAAVTLIVK